MPSPFYTIVTYGTDRCWIVYKLTGLDVVQANVARLEEEKKAKPTLNWAIFHKSDLTPEEFLLLEKLNLGDPAQYRVKDGFLEERPTAWVTVAGANEVGSTLSVSCHYSGEAPSTHRVAINDQEFDCSPEGSIELELVDPQEVRIRPVSAPHYCMVTAVEVKESQDA